MHQWGIMHKTSALLTIKEAADILGRDRRTVTVWLRENRIPRLGIDIAGRLYVRRHVLANTDPSTLLRTRHS